VELNTKFAKINKFNRLRKSVKRYYSRMANNINDLGEAEARIPRLLNQPLDASQLLGSVIWIRLDLRILADWNIPKPFRNQGWCKATVERIVRQSVDRNNLEVFTVEIICISFFNTAVDIASIPCQVDLKSGTAWEVVTSQTEKRDSDNIVRGNNTEHPHNIMEHVLVREEGVTKPFGDLKEASKRLYRKLDHPEDDGISIISDVESDISDLDIDTAQKYGYMSKERLRVILTRQHITVENEQVREYLRLEDSITARIKFIRIMMRKENQGERRKLIQKVKEVSLSLKTLNVKWKAMVKDIADDKISSDDTRCVYEIDEDNPYLGMLGFLKHIIEKY
jgi:hypothetical protein